MNLFVKYYEKYSNSHRVRLEIRRAPLTILGETRTACTIQSILDEIRFLLRILSMLKKNTDPIEEELSVYEWQKPLTKTYRTELYPCRTKYFKRTFRQCKRSVVRHLQRFNTHRRFLVNSWQGEFPAHALRREPHTSPAANDVKTYAAHCRRQTHRHKLFSVSCFQKNDYLLPMLQNCQPYILEVFCQS